ncbi:hypothetical protein KKY_3881 [Pelagibacterium halotolerans B2]|uniref:Uncharacterized protein n=1 Tax=Pelagibacterium halotolerans (strain DSM 22347 / JCM 15775 / CGMCC 1.7692 / B2) TaxID=1082931 RepID=G4RDV1_PELHB|nr:hypothetical protein KKY_3881 [Pelagibacterium halotolerans B2]
MALGAARRLSTTKNGRRINFANCGIRLMRNLPWSAFQQVGGWT